MLKVSITRRLDKDVTSRSSKNKYHKLDNVYLRCLINHQSLHGNNLECAVILKHKIREHAQRAQHNTRAADHSLHPSNICREFVALYKTFLYFDV